MFNFIKSRLSPLASSNFRLFYFSQSFSLIGTWSHELARSWLVLDLAGTTTALGTLLLSMALPSLFLTLHGGVVADRADVRKLILITKIILTISAFSLFVIVEVGALQLWILYAFAIVEGFVNSFDGPAFTSVFSRTVTKSDFQQALALQSMSFHISRMLGPAVAGFIMAISSPGMVFLFDGISYLAVLFMIRKIKLRDREQSQPLSEGGGFNQMFSGLKHFLKDEHSKYKLYQFFLSVALIIPLLLIVFRTYLKQKFSLSSEEFGYLFSFPALGALLGAIYILFSALNQPIRNLILGVPALVVSLLGLKLASTPLSASLVLTLIGFFNYLNIASLTQSLQIQTSDQYRGRLSALINMGFSSVAALMSFPIGVYTDSVGFERAIAHLTWLFAILSIALAWKHHRSLQRVLE